MTETPHPVDLLPELALGVLPEEDAATVRAHLADCPSCEAEFAEMRRVALLLPLAAEDTAPSPAVKDGLLERIAREPRALPAPVARRRTLPWFAAAAAGVALLVVGGAVGYVLNSSDNSDLKQEIARQGDLVEAVARGNASTAHTTSGDVQMAFLRAPGASEGFAWVEGMPTLPSGKAYEAWFSKDGKTFEPSTVFTTDNGGVWIDAGSDLGGFAAMAFTIEDAGGSQQPTQAPFAVMDLKTSAMVIP